MKNNSKTINIVFNLLITLGIFMLSIYSIRLWQKEGIILDKSSTTSMFGIVLLIIMKHLNKINHEDTIKDDLYLLSPLPCFVQSLDTQTKIKLIDAISKKVLYIGNTFTEIDNIPPSYLTKRVMRYGLREGYIEYELVD